MKWIKQNDCFLLSRHELADLFQFNIAWMFEPAKKRPIGYKEFHKDILIPVDAMLMEHLAEEEMVILDGASEKAKESASEYDSETDYISRQ